MFKETEMKDVVKLFEAHTENMSDQVFDHWLPRMISGGADFNDILRIRKRLTSWKDWPHLWKEYGDRHLELAEKAEEKGHFLTAGRAYRRASMYYHYAQFMLFDRPELKKTLHKICMDIFQKALKYLPYPGEKLYIPFDEGQIPAHLRVSEKHDGRIVIMIPGADATKEELSTFDEVFLERGISTLTIDGPGQGETANEKPYSKKAFDHAIQAVVAYIENELGYDKIGVGGISFGGYLGPRAASVSPSIKAAFGCGGPFDFRDIEIMGPIFYADFAHVLGVKTYEEVLELRDEIDLSDVISDLKCPLMIVHGTEDKIIDVKHSKPIVERSSSVEPNLVIIEDGNHVCNNYVYIYRPMIGDWMVEKLQ